MKIEGRNAVLELIKSNATVDGVFIQNGMRDEPSRTLLAELKRVGIKVSFVDKSVLDRMSPSGKHQGFIANVSDYEYAELEDILSATVDRDCCIVILDGVEDPHNLGSVIRVCECAGVDGLIIGKHRSASVNDTVMRISEGSASHLKIARVTNINSAVDELKKNNIWVYALETGGEGLYKTNLRGRTALLIGGENSGVNRLTKEKCDKVVSIPMYGQINSLNASVAAGIAVYEVVRQKL